MKTESVLLNNLCVPCACRCRYCLLSWDGKTVGTDWERGNRFAERFKGELLKSRPELKFSYSFGYSMEHPDLRNALRYLCAIGSPQSEFLQCDGMRMRDERECRELTEMMREEGVKSLNFTIYGVREYHDRFAARKGDFDFIIRLMRVSVSTGLSVSARIPLTSENIGSINDLVSFIKSVVPSCIIMLFIPHEEGRGILLNPVRLKEDELELLEKETRGYFNREVYRPEREWITEDHYIEESKRMVLISMRNDNIDRYESMSASEIVAETEELDDRYYALFPTFSELAKMFGDPDGRRLYHQRDLFHHYRGLYAEEHNLKVYDVTDERQSGTRRY